MIWSLVAFALGRLCWQTPTYATSTSATFALSPALTGVSVYASGGVYLTAGNALERVTSAGAVFLVAGNLTTSGSAVGVGSAAQFNGPIGTAADSQGNIYVTVIRSTST
jgi:hypothetical protein